MSLPAFYSIKSNILNLVLILILSINISISAQTSQTDPYLYLVNELANKKIIMLADYGHGEPLPYKSLIKFLDSWLDKLEIRESNDINVTLILEGDKEIADNLNEYILSGNIQPVLQYWLPFNTLEMLEFYNDLRREKLRVDKLNVHRDIKNKISLSFYGGEALTVFSHPEYLKKSLEEIGKDFEFVRDSLSANNIIEFMDKDKTMKAVIYYGTAHLIKNYVIKSKRFTHSQTQTKNRYLANYLKEKYSDDSVFAVAQLPMIPELLNDDIIEKDGDTLIYSENIPWDYLQPENYDAIIFKYEEGMPGHNMSYIFSQRILKSNIERMMFLEKYLPGYLAERYYNNCMESLYLLTGRNFKTIPEWKDWIDTNNYKGFERMSSDEFSEQLFNMYERDTTSATKIKLFKLGFGPGILSPEKVSRHEWFNTDWPEILPKLKYLNAIGLLWIGTEEEKDEAKMYLDKLGPSFSEPQLYLKYYRKMIFHVNY